MMAARKLSEREKKRLRKRTMECQAWGGATASLFLEEELNAAVGANCYFFAGSRWRPKGVLSVFFPEEEQAEFTAAEFVPGWQALQRLFAEALRQCKQVGVTQIYTVVNPAFGFCKMKECGVCFSYVRSEYMLCRDMKGLAELRGYEKTNITLQKKKVEEGYSYQLLREGRQMVGCQVVQMADGGCYLFGLRTEEAVRRQGFASLLLIEIAKEFAKEGAARMHLQVASENEPAERLYRKLGFWTEEQRDYYKTEEYSMEQQKKETTKANRQKDREAKEKAFLRRQEQKREKQAKEAQAQWLREQAKKAEDTRFMREALRQAKKAASLGEVPIGAVLVKDGKILARGYNRRNTDKTTLAHAEITAIRKASRRLGDWRLEECTLYVTLEPCPMCAGAIVQARILRVVAGCMNPKAGCAGSVLNLLNTPGLNHKVLFEKGILEKECTALLQSFFKELRQNGKKIEK